MQLDCRGRVLDLSQSRVMGILNVTPDSFSDGGLFVGRDAAVRQALRMVQEGADLLDIGGESTRPGAAAVSADEELARVVPVLEAIRGEVDVPLSVDTSKPEVMREAVAAGAGLINDVYALRREGALEAVAALDLPVCLMHMQGEPRTMQQDPQYTDVVGEVAQFLGARAEACEAAGIAPGRILLDPGFGFGKRLEHNYSLLRHLDRLSALGRPLLVGISRKSMIGQVLDASVEERVYGSVSAAAIAAWHGAAIIRVHDVKPTVDALRVVGAARNAP